MRRRDVGIHELLALLMQKLSASYRIHTRQIHTIAQTHLAIIFFFSRPMRGTTKEARDAGNTTREKGESAFERQSSGGRLDRSEFLMVRQCGKEQNSLLGYNLSTSRLLSLSFLPYTLTVAKIWGSEVGDRVLGTGDRRRTSIFPRRLCGCPGADS